jgi:hypothetical protein
MTGFDLLEIKTAECWSGGLVGVCDLFHPSHLYAIKKGAKHVAPLFMR